MSSEPDYNFNQPTSNSEGVSLLLPFALLCAAIAVVMVAQTVNVFKARGSLKEGKAKLTEAYNSRQTLVKQSQELQQKLQALVLDLLLLAKTDDEAKAIVQKFGIQQTGAAAPEGAPAEAPK